MRFRDKTTSAWSPALSMTAMIDIVFLLLAFFILTFQVAMPEGDLFVDAPAGSAAAASPPLDFRIPIILRLDAGPGGELAGISMNGRRLAGIDELQQLIAEAVGGPAASADDDDWEVIVDCDPRLRYQHTIDVLSAVRGRVQADGSIQPLIRNVRFFERR